jgi:hypothetical protein
LGIATKGLGEVVTGKDPPVNWVNHPAIFDRKVARFTRYISYIHLRDLPAGYPPCGDCSFLIEYNHATWVAYEDFRMPSWECFVKTLLCVL